MVYATRDDTTGDNSMQKGSRQSASITALDPGSSLKLLAYDAFKVIKFESVGSFIVLKSY
jgi:hypothetical protein